MLFLTVILLGGLILWLNALISRTADAGMESMDTYRYLEVERAEIHALIGENGAGKSTLMNVLSGTYPFGSYEGDIYYNGELCKFKRLKDSEAKGIVIIHQELGIIAVSRDCFPIALSTQRRENIVKAYKGEIYDCPITVENEKDMLAAVADVNKAECNALVVFLGIKDIAYNQPKSLPYPTENPWA